MATTEPDVGEFADASAASGFLPDVATIERLANTFFKGLSGGAPLAPPAIPSSAPAPWSAPAAPIAPIAEALPARPPFGFLDPAADSAPASLPLRSFGGASAGSAAPASALASRVALPAAAETLVSPPRLDSLAPMSGATIDEAAISPFARELDLRGALAALRAGSPNATLATPAAAAPPEAPAPSSLPVRSFGGASAGSAAPASALASRAVLPVAAETLVSPPRLDSLATTSSAPIDEAAISPFAAEVDLRGALAALRAGFPNETFATPAAAAPPEAPAPADVQAFDRAPVAAAALAPVQPISPQLGEAGSGVRPFDAASIRDDFPILREKVHGRRLIWLDNGATTQKPQAVIDRLAFFYTHENSNVHRAAHTLAARATDAYEDAREKARRFLNASSTREIVFVRGATEGINLVAQSWGRRNVREGDEIVITWLEHHANIVPWQQLCSATGAKLRVAPVDDNGDVKLDDFDRLLGPRTRIVALPTVSNALGTVTPAAEMIAMAHRHGALALVDGAQSVAHRLTDVQALDADFFVFSGHKMFAPTGIGVVYGKQAILDSTPPWQGGGSMITDVTFERTLYQAPPARFEAGTGNIADAVGLGAAIDYLDRVGLNAIERYEHELIEATVAGLGVTPGVRLIGRPRERAGVISFVVDGSRAEDVGKALDREGIAVRAGHHCAQPILRRFGLEATVRPSFALYNTHEDVEALVAAVRRIAIQAQGSSRP